MIGQTNEDSFIRLEHQFQYGDSIKIIRKQVEKYEELVKEQAERLERMKNDYKDTEKLRNQTETVKNIR